MPDTMNQQPASQQSPNQQTADQQPNQPAQQLHPVSLDDIIGAITRCWHMTCHVTPDHRTPIVVSPLLVVIYSLRNLTNRL
jgi:hypothetical protein